MCTRETPVTQFACQATSGGVTVTICQSVHWWLSPSGSEKIGASMCTSAGFSTMLSVPGSVMLGVFGGVAAATLHSAKNDTAMTAAAKRRKKAPFSHRPHPCGTDLVEGHPIRRGRARQPLSGPWLNLPSSALR